MSNRDQLRTYYSLTHLFKPRKKTYDKMDILQNQLLLNVCLKNSSLELPLPAS
jgi:hypothetical protein